MRLHTSRATSAFFLSLLIATNGSGPVLADGLFPAGFPFPGSAGPKTASPIKHLVVIFGENESFDHYFGTYPNATNPPGEPPFTARPFTPKVNGYTSALLNSNPNYTNTANGTGAANPFRLDRSQAHTASMNHNYGPEQQAYDDGKMDLFPKYTGRSGIAGATTFTTNALVMGYYDGNTVTALWNYAQHFAMSDNSYSTTFGPSTPGAVNLISGQTNGAIGYTAGSAVNQQYAIGIPGGTAGAVVPVASPNLGSSIVDDGQGGATMYGDSDPLGDSCSSTSASTTVMTGKNIGDLLNAKNISWGWFEGGFDLTLTNANGTTGCARSSTSVTLGSTTAKDYVPHHQPFQYYASTRNPLHTRPSSVATIGTSNDGGANHQYDSHDFFDALNAGNMPAVSFLKAPAFQDAHPSNSDPIDEQDFIVSIVNAVKQSKFWDSTAVIIAYDDSDGWYDHVNHLVNPSTSTQDALLATGQCGPLNGNATLVPGTPPASALVGLKGLPVNGRCGYGPRQPLLVISPYAKENFVDHTVTDQASITRFIEDNWLGSQRIGQGSYDKIAGPIDNMFNFFQPPLAKLFLDPFWGTIR
jgi:phospholipase C